MEADALQHVQVIKRDRSSFPFERDKIRNAITKCVIDVEGLTSASSASRQGQVEEWAYHVCNHLQQRPHGNTFTIEEIQDAVELTLMRAGEHKLARSYVIYRDKRARIREENEFSSTQQVSIPLATEGKSKAASSVSSGDLYYDHVTATGVELSKEELDELVKEAKDHTPRDVKPEDLYNARLEALITSARNRIAQSSRFDFLAARLQIQQVHIEVLAQVGVVVADDLDSYTGLTEKVRAKFKEFFELGVEKGLHSDLLLQFDLEDLAKVLDFDNDNKFRFLGLDTLYSRYFQRVNDKLVEAPQVFLMRVAMGLAIAEDDKNARAKEFYQLLSSLAFMSSTPTLFNSGTKHSQLSSCFISTVGDDLRDIYQVIADNAQLSKLAGGLGNDWTPVRASNSLIQSTGGRSNGVIPFLKVAEATAVAVNQGGKRAGALCAYLETWHLDIRDFLELRKNTGDERRRTHDINTANWIPDLFMERMLEKKDWTLFSPSDVPDLHDLVGSEFKERYEHYEKQVDAGVLRGERVPAFELWQRMLQMLAETGHPWITFKDACNIRSPQQHVGRVHSSNLCTEITLNTSSDEVAVCNLGSINLAAHMHNGELDVEKLGNSVRTAVRMLDNVIDINFYAVDAARRANMRHRAIGLGMMGYLDALYMADIQFDSQEAVEFADRTMEQVSYFALEASADLASERGSYKSFEGSKWSQGILPLDTYELLRQHRSAEYLDIDTSASLDWEPVRAKVKKGMRNSNVLAIAPTATIGNICGVRASIEPLFGNIFSKENRAGVYQEVNTHLERDLEEQGLWNELMVLELKRHAGSIQEIKEIPQKLRDKYKSIWEIDEKWLIEAGARRAKWIDQSQSLNFYQAHNSGPRLSDAYVLAWKRGIKTTYYLRSQSATHIEKTTIESDDLQSVALEVTTAPEPEPVAVAADLDVPVPPVCTLDDPDCEACQ